MRGANMSVVGRTVVKCFATRFTSERVLGDTFVVRIRRVSRRCGCADGLLDDWDE